MSKEKHKKTGSDCPLFLLLALLRVDVGVESNRDRLPIEYGFGDLVALAGGNHKGFARRTRLSDLIHWDTDNKVAIDD